MGSLFQTLFDILAQPTGSLAYQLVVVVSIIGALQSTIFLPEDEAPITRRRMVRGLLGLLALRAIPFLAALLAAQGLNSVGLLLPLIDRVVLTLSILIILWLWNFPDGGHRSYDLGTLILGGVLLLVAVVSGVVWYGQGGVSYFNSTVIGWTWLALPTILAFVGIALLSLNRPENWGSGVAMLGLLGLGELFQIFSLNLDSDYAVVSRLFQIGAFPILFSLISRLAPEYEYVDGYEYQEAPEVVESEELVTAPPVSEEEDEAPSGPYRVPGVVFKSALSLAGRDPKKICQNLTLQIAHAMVADICLLASPPSLDGDITIYCGYDLIRQNQIQGRVIEQRMIPGIADAVKNGRSLQIPTTSTTNNLVGLAREFQVKNVGNFLALPIMDPESTPIAVVILLSPFSNYVWTGEDQVFFREASPLISDMLRQSWNESEQINVVDQTLEELDKARNDRETLRQENEALRVELAALDIKAQEMSGNQGLSQEEKAAFQANMEKAKKQLQLLKSENEDLKQNLIELRAAQKVAEAASSEAQSKVDELTQAMSEVSVLQSKLAEAEEKIAELEVIQKSSDDSENLSNEQVEVVASIAQDLRQPMSSIVGYADLLLSESVGILGALQRKFLERIKTSTERMNQLVANLIQMTALEAGSVALSMKPIDLMAVFDDAISSVSGQLREKKIILRVDIEPELPRVVSDRDALEQIVSHLLHNAGAATPADGEVFFKVEALGQNGSEQIKIQVVDSGEGIPTEDLPRVFTRLYRADNPLIQGVGDTGVGLSIAKTLTEKLGGAIQVESKIGAGSIFEVTLPTVAPVVEAE